MSIGIVGPIVQHFLQGLGMVVMASPCPFPLPQQTLVGTPLVSCGTSPRQISVQNWQGMVTWKSLHELALSCERSHSHEQHSEGEPWMSIQISIPWLSWWGCNAIRAFCPRPWVPPVIPSALMVAMASSSVSHPHELLKLCIKPLHPHGRMPIGPSKGGNTKYRVKPLGGSTPKMRGLGWGRW
jgi:hypothetical protein